MIVVGSIETHGSFRLATIIARKAATSDGILTWVTAAGAVCCAHANSTEARHVVIDAPAYIVGVYATGATWEDIRGDLMERANELDTEKRPRAQRKAA